MASILSRPQYVKAPWIYKFHTKEKNKYAEYADNAHAMFAC